MTILISKIKNNRAPGPQEYAILPAKIKQTKHISDFICVYLCLALQIKETTPSFLNITIFFCFGFSWISYVQNRKEVQQIIHMIDNYKFKKENKFIYEGRNFFQKLKHELWEQRCQDLLHTFFSRNEQFPGIITFPETDITAQGKPWKTF